ncbi:MAG TPA: tetratricopeptide repeat-containing glycosyltransferase family protein, partial [Gemmataceae bacterium]|nr:tetratricopeptide repeat-containing glycosyltransferase family protein [Gemmataceae bacterium]
YEEAMVHYQKALQSRPDHAEGHYNLGVVLAKLARFDEALGCYRRTLELQPDHLDARNNLGNVLKDMGKFDDAHAAFDQALARNPDYGEGHLSRSLLLLLQGDFERGWPGYTWRWKRTGYANRTFSQPHWDGSSLEDRAVLLHAEQGFGDTLHFIRYAPLVKQRGGRVIVECPKSLIPLLESAAGIDQLVASGSKLPEFDVEAALPSLPCIFRTTAGTIPKNVPYLQADAALVEQWRRELAPLKGFKIGIAWQGQALYPGDRLRSIPLIHFAQLAKREGVHLVSLQKGTGTEQLRDLPGDLRVLNFGDRLDSTGAFMNTAAIMKNLDLVITSDTAIPHLAGALGVPVWLATQFVPDWRWLLEREDSPWYPTMRLFRQTRLFDWDEVFQKIGQALSSVM